MSEPPPPGSRRGPLLALAVIVALVAGAWWIFGQVHATGALQDCVMAGRRNCAPIGQ